MWDLKRARQMGLNSLGLTNFLVLTRSASDPFRLVEKLLI